MEPRLQTTKGPSVNELDERLLALLPDDQDLPYEEELLRNPYNVKLWLRYIASRKDAPAKRRNVLYERALRALPGSYKVLLIFRIRIQLFI